MLRFLARFCSLTVLLPLAFASTVHAGELARVGHGYQIANATASLWSELGTSSASNGGLSQSLPGVDGAAAIAFWDEVVTTHDLLG